MKFVPLRLIWVGFEYENDIRRMVSADYATWFDNISAIVYMFFYGQEDLFAVQAKTDGFDCKSPVPVSNTPAMV